MTAPTLTARTPRRDERDIVVEVCLAAFADEAVIAWVIPDPRERQRSMRQMFGTSLDAALAAEAVICAIDADGDPVGASIWLPHTTAPATPEDGPPAPAPEAGPPAATPETGPPADATDASARRTAIVEAATSARRPAVPHLKLDAMAALPEHRGQGAGSAMLAAGLAHARTLDLPVYLEASTSDNRRLYTRRGFRDLGEPIDLPDGGPSLQPMWRGQETDGEAAHSGVTT